MTDYHPPHTQNARTLFLLCAVGCLAALAIGGLFQPGEWYTTLNRAPWNPANIVFPIVWTTLYIMIAFSGWIIAKSRQRALIIVWWTQLAFNAAWSWLFFGEQWVWLALIDIVIILLLVGWLIVQCRRDKDTRFAGTLLIPYFAWLCLALSLNAYIALYN